MKTPKEKAKELVEKYKPFCKDTKHTGIIDGLATCMNDEVLNHLAAKQCALIAVDEITSILAVINNEEQFNVSKYGNYWHEVKQEIQAL